jgi:hypothetical protein
MATGDGIGFHQTIIREHLKETGQHVVKHVINRQVFWARYVDVSRFWRSNVFFIVEYCHLTNNSSSGL